MDEYLIKNHRISRPYKKNDKSFIESFNRTVRKESLGWKEYKKNDLSLAKDKINKFHLLLSQLQNTPLFESTNS